MDKKQIDEFNQRNHKQISTLAVLTIPCSFLICGVIWEMLGNLIGQYGVLGDIRLILTLISFIFVVKFLINLAVKAYLWPKFKGESPTLKYCNLPKRLYTYIIPALAIIVACVEFRGYGMYRLVRILVGLQSAVYAYILFSYKSDMIKALAVFFIILGAIFFPVFGISFNHGTWKILDLVFAGISVYTNLHIFENNKE